MSTARRLIPSDQVAPEAIESQWSDLWNRVGEQGPTPRIRTETVVALTRREPSAALLAVRHAAPRHPGRFITLVMDPEGDPPAAAVDLCYRPDGGASGEAVCVNVEGPLAQHWAELALPLLLPDLPVYLWILHPALATLPELDRLLPAVDHILLDSAEVVPPWTVWTRFHDMRNRVGLMDLEWTRVVPWRRLLAQAFDPPECLALLDGLRGVSASGTEAGRTRALWLWAWLGTQLGYDRAAGTTFTRGTAIVPFDYRTERQGDPLRTVTLDFGAGTTLTARREAHDLTVVVESGKRVLFRHRHPEGDWDLGEVLSRTLSHGFDPVFGHVLDWIRLGEESSDA
jgi:glucose-6-phosphate dehydrogenase assembly protein OpcA